MYACSDSGGPPGVGPLARLTIQAGNSQTALAGTVLPNPIVIVPQDDASRTVDNQTATFTVIAGGGFLSSSTGTTNADGTITAPTWTLGKSDVPQELRVTIGGTTTTVTATVQTAYRLVVRFFGGSPPSDQQALFTSAAARIRAIIVGAVPRVNAAGADVSPCTGTPVPVLNEIIDGLMIFAAIDSIDGPGKILGRAGPCYYRQDAAGETDFRTIIGVMRFDSADIGALAGSGNLQEVILHEMMHVVGLGTTWDSTARDLIINSGLPGAAYIGPGGVAGCRAVGGLVTCESSVPVEDCVGIPASADCGEGQLEGHWKETTFGRELMTPYLSSGTNQLSVMTVRSLEDLNYTVNTAAADAYTIAVGSLSAMGSMSSSPTPTGRWEQPLGVIPRTLPTATGN